MRQAPFEDKFVVIAGGVMSKDRRVGVLGREKPIAKLVHASVAREPDFFNYALGLIVVGGDLQYLGVDVIRQVGQGRSIGLDVKNYVPRVED